MINLTELTVSGCADLSAAITMNNTDSPLDETPVPTLLGEHRVLLTAIYETISNVVGIVAHTSLLIPMG